MRQVVVLGCLSACVLWGLGAGCGEASGTPQGETPRWRKYIRGGTYGRIVAEVDYVDGSGPNPEVLSSVANDLETLLDKPNGIVLRQDDVLEPRGSDHIWSDDELVALSERNFDPPERPGTVAMNILYVDGGYEEDTEGSAVLGLAWDNVDIAIFGESIDEACSEEEREPPLLRRRICRKVEETVLVHEIGHTIGLVNNGLPMVADHQDEARGAHCDNDGCVMFWKNRRSNLSGRITDRFMRGNEDALGFGSECRADVAAVRDR